MKLHPHGITRLGALLVVVGLLVVIVGCSVNSLPADDLKAAAEELIISDREASEHVGEQVAVRGVVADVHISRKGDVFLNFGSRYPNQTFYAVIFRDHAGLFQNPKQWEGREVIVRGRIKLYKGKPEIILTDPAQLSSVPR